MLSCLWEARMREGRFRTSLRIAGSTAIGLSLGKLAMGFGFRNVTATDVEANGTKVAASVIFPDDPQQRLEVWWKNANSSGIYLIVIARKSEWTAPGGLRLGLTLAR